MHPAHPHHTVAGTLGAAVTSIVGAPARLLPKVHLPSSPSFKNLENVEQLDTKKKQWMSGTAALDALLAAAESAAGPHTGDGWDDDEIGLDELGLEELQAVFAEGGTR